MSRRLWALAFLVAWLPLQVGAVTISAKINGVTKPIGTIDASIPDITKPARVTGEFLFDKNFAFLDDWYNFQWLNVEVKYTLNGAAQANDPVVGKLPAIDPQPGPKEDNIPWYFNGKEYKAGVFDGVKIREDGVASRFVDRPSDGTKNSQIDFMTFLVLENVTDPTIKKTDFCVLGWFDWTYDNKSDSAKGESSVATVSGVVDKGMVDLINTAMGNAGGGGFPNYVAMMDCNLTACVPEGNAFIATGLGVAFIFFAARMRKPTPAT